MGNVFHAGDGNLHPLLMFDSRNEKELEQVHKAGWDIMEICAEFGGTISGEHGIGEEKREAMKMIFSGHDLNTQQNLKSAFDPKNLLNPTKIIPLPPEGADKLPDSEPTILKRRVERRRKVSLRPWRLSDLHWPRTKLSGLQVRGLSMVTAINSVRKVW